MFKRTLPLLLTLTVLLTACVSSPNKNDDSTELSCPSIAEIMLAAVETDELNLEAYYDLSYVQSYSADYYGLSGVTLSDGAIIRGQGASAFELAVLILPAQNVSLAAEKLQDYLLRRQGAFTGYAPDQAALLENALVLTHTQCVALIACEHPDAVRDAFESCFGDGVNAVPRTAPTESAAVPDAPQETAQAFYDRTPFTDPGLDDMTIYDTSAILAAWESGDTSVLSDKDAVTLRVAQNILEKCLTKGMSDYEKEVALYRWICTNVNYDWSHQDPSAETPRESYEPFGALVNKTAVCLGYASGFQLLMDLAGIECITVTGAAFQSQENHAWNMVKLNGQWYCTDATWDIYGDTPQSWNYFNVTSDWMAETNHQWDYTSVPEATATDGGIA